MYRAGYGYRMEGTPFSTALQSSRLAMSPHVAENDQNSTSDTVPICSELPHSSLLQSEPAELRYRLPHLDLHDSSRRHFEHNGRTPWNLEDSLILDSDCVINPCSSTMMGCSERSPPVPPSKNLPTSDRAKKVAAEYALKLRKAAAARRSRGYRTRQKEMGAKKEGISCCET